MSNYEFRILQDDGIELLVKCDQFSSMQKLVDALSQFLLAAGFSQVTIDKYILHSFNDNEDFGK